MKNKILFSILAVLVTILSYTIVDAKTINRDDIPSSTYIIGTHMFTRDVNQDKGYDGKLTTNLIMLASKTIDGNSINDMVIYYKTASGKWINGLNGTVVSAPESFKINYTNKALEEDNDTVKAPKKPIIFWDAALTYSKDKDSFPTALFVLLDDINDQSNKVDGVELRVRQSCVIHGFDETYDLTYDKYFKGSTVTVNSDFTKDVEGIKIGNTYHCYSMYVDGFVYPGHWEETRINARAYALDENGKKVYSDTLVDYIDEKEYLPVVQLKRSNLAYTSEGSYVCNLELELPWGWSTPAVNWDSYAYCIYEEINGEATGRFNWKKFGLNEKVAVTIPENAVAKYYAKIGYYNNEGRFVELSTKVSDREVLTIDTRTLTVPVLSVSPPHGSEGEAVYGLDILNRSFYEKQGEDTLDNQIEGFEIYELCKDGYKLVSEGMYNQSYFKRRGRGYYTARAYATNAEGKRVYSDFSKIETIDIIPIIKVSDITEGKVNLSIANRDEYKETVKISVYKYNGEMSESLIGYFWLSDDPNLNNDSISIDVDEDMDICVRASKTVYDYPDGLVYAYSDYSWIERISP